MLALQCNCHSFKIPNAGNVEPPLRLACSSALMTTKLVLHTHSVGRKVELLLGLYQMVGYSLSPNCQFIMN